MAGYNETVAESYGFVSHEEMLASDNLTPKLCATLSKLPDLDKRDR